MDTLIGRLKLFSKVKYSCYEHCTPMVNALMVAQTLSYLFFCPLAESFSLWYTVKLKNFNSQTLIFKFFENRAKPKEDIHTYISM